MPDASRSHRIRLLDPHHPNTCSAVSTKADSRPSASRPVHHDMCASTPWIAEQCQGRRRTAATRVDSSALRSRIWRTSSASLERPCVRRDDATSWQPASRPLIIVRSCCGYIGMEAVNPVLVGAAGAPVRLLFHRRGIEKEVDEFLTVNPGLAGRFNRKPRFESYSPDELVEIAVRYGRPRASTIEPRRWRRSTRPAGSCAPTVRPTARTASTSCRTAGSPATWWSGPSGCGTHGGPRSTEPIEARSPRRSRDHPGAGSESLPSGWRAPTSTSTFRCSAGV